MAGDEFHKKLSGQVWRPGAKAVSSLMDAAADAKARRSPPFRSDAVDQFYQSGIVKVLNTTAAPIPRFGVLGITGPVITPAANLGEFQRQVALNGVTPAAAQAGNFAVMMDAVPAGAIGRGVVSGVTPCQVKVGSGGFADVLAGDVAQLQQQGGGAAQILWQDPTVAAGGTAWAVVRLGSGGASSFAGCRLGMNPAQTWFNADNNTIKWWTGTSGNYDPSGFLQPDGVTIKVPGDGFYEISARLAFIPAGSAQLQLSMSINKTGVLEYLGSSYAGPQNFPVENGLAGTTTVRMFAGDFFTASWYCDLTGGLTPTANYLYSKLTVSKIG